MATDIGLIRAVSSSFPRYVDYAAGAKAYINQWYNEKKIDAEKMRKEAAAYKLAEQKRAADQEKFYSKFKDLDKEKQFPYLTGYNQVMAATSKNMAYNAAKMDPGFGRQEIMNRAQQGIDQAAIVNQEWKEYIANVADRDSEYAVDEKGNYIRKEDTKSNINDAFTYEFDRKRNNGEFQTSYGKDGKPVYIFDKKDFDKEILDTEGGKKAFTEGDQIIVPHDEIFKIYSIKEKQTQKYISAIDSIESNLPKLLNRGYDVNSVNSLIDETIDNLKLTDDEALSIAVDELSLLPPEYAGTLTQYFDENEDGSVLDDLLPKIKQEFKNVINTPLQRELQAKNRKTAIDDTKDKKEPSDFAILGEDIATNVIKDPVSQFQEFSAAPIKYDKLNKVISIETGTDKDGNKLEPEKFNLNKETDYLRFIDFVLLQSSYTSSERSKILNSARKWVKERSSMFETKNTDMTSSDLLGLPTFN